MRPRVRLHHVFLCLAYSFCLISLAIVHRIQFGNEDTGVYGQQEQQEQQEQQQRAGIKQNNSIRPSYHHPPPPFLQKGRQFRGFYSGLKSTDQSQTIKIFDSSRRNETIMPSTSLSSSARTEFTNNTTELVELVHWAGLRNKSSVDYYTCCGLGHRMSKLVDAHYVSKQKNLGLRVYWGHCNKTEVFHYLFGRQPQEELENVTSTGLRLIIANDAPGFKKMIRDQSPEHCQQKCQNSVEVEHAAYYEKLRNRFRQKDEVDTFREMYFSNYTVIGMHVRAGNGEKGDFGKKHRAINNTAVWTESVVETLTRMINAWYNNSSTITTTVVKPPLLFIATDTPSIIVGFQEALAGKMPVLDYRQSRPPEGSGVLFGEFVGENMREGQKCLENWDNAVIDMMILSHADVIVSARASSFTQSLPMSIALARPKSDRVIPQTYCELHPSGSSSRCYEDFMEWCCEGRSDYHLAGAPIRYEYRRMPINIETATFNIVKRDPQPGRPPNPCRIKCVLPYDWGEIDSQ